MPKKVYIVTHPEAVPKKIEPGEEYVELKPEEILMEWKAREFIQYPRHKSWYILLLVISGILVIYSIIVTNYLFAIIVVMLAIVINTLTRKEPQMLNIAITTKGVKIDEKLYTYDDDLASFWILYNPPDLKTLNFSRKQRIAPDLVIQLENQNPLKVRELLLDHLTEDVEKEEHPVDKIARRFGL
jgi:hypothetical protein